MREKLFGLPDDTLVYPGHDYNGRRVSSIVQEKQRNPRLGGDQTLQGFRDLMANLNLPNTTASAACRPNPAACTTVQGLLGRLPTGSSTTGTTTIALIDNDHRLFSGERRTQLDMRFAKILRFGGTRADIGVDVGNLLNTNYATTWENTYQYSINNTSSGGTWDNPTAIYSPRFVRLNFTVGF